jgi:multidrug efflux pump
VRSLSRSCGKKGEPHHKPLVPMFIAGGAGANARHSVATGIIGGMIVASSIALFFIPMFFYLIQSSGERFASAKSTSPKIPPQAAPERPPGGLPTIGG